MTIARRANLRSTTRAAAPASLDDTVPTLIRLLVIIAALVGLVYGGMIALVSMVKVQPREMTEIVKIPKAPQ